MYAFDQGLVVGLAAATTRRGSAHEHSRPVATVLIGHWTGTYNRGQLDRVLAGDDPFDERTMLDEDHSEGERTNVIPGVDRAEDDTRER
jgi:aerobic C4-dicarboxylate transport protein